MKFLVYIFAFVFSLGVYAQEPIKIDSSKGPEVFKPVDVMPEYPGGIQALYKFIDKTMVYPKEEKKAKIGGKVHLKFIVQETGEIKDIVVTKSSGNENIDKEAIRIVSVMPKWKPGSQEGKPVPVFFNLPINFNPNY